MISISEKPRSWELLPAGCKSRTEESRAQKFAGSESQCPIPAVYQLSPTMHKYLITL